MSHFPLHPLVYWAVRDLRRRPLETSLLTAAVLFTIALTATPLLLNQALTSTWKNILSTAPSLVVREFNAMGWTPIAAQEAVDIAESVTGVTDVRTRVWGHVGGPLGMLTVIGVEPDRPPPWVSQSPNREEVILGADIEQVSESTELTLIGQIKATLRVIGRFEAITDPAVGNAVLVHVDTARKLLGIPTGYASDLAVEVFNSAEESAILPDLTAAFPRPVRITTRSETAGIRVAGLAQRAGATVALLVPALLALCLLVMVTVRERLGRRFEIGLLKTLGWTTGDIISLQSIRGFSISAIGIAGGMLLASALVYQNGASWPGVFYPEWHELPSRLSFNPLDLALPLLEATGLVVLPFLTATIGAALRCAASEPGDVLEKSDG